MRRVRRGLIHAVAWSLATGAAVTLSWWGVHTVMAGTVYDPPRALPISAEAPSGEGTGRAAKPQVSPTPSARKPSPSASPQPERPTRPTKSPSSSAGSTAPDEAGYQTPTTPSPGNVKPYAVDGGRVVFEIGASSASLVSATPDPGWSMQVWKQPTWIRVTFTGGDREVSVFCTWHDGPPRVETFER
ncbi:hypothetical protein [Streptomyces sp. GC420]|uniref:hypothetical protein n=1 Tax=Streptomyces sp. GC420 TaxID=2697568 RepID=UPI001AA1CE80|nr:hypothetical protein [Streptomyces sp. GC420]NBM20076.1 hypothetical protein [Streptomyces sp. GC420]